MHFILAILIWLLMAAVLCCGVVAAVKGSVLGILFLAGGLLGFFILFTWIGCSTH
jgi:hypothetical protein